MKSPSNVLNKMNIILFDPQTRNKLAPLTHTRSIADIRIGILTIKERWEIITGKKVFILTENYLQDLYQPIPDGDYFFIDSTFLNFIDLKNKLLNINSKEIIDEQLNLIFKKITYKSIDRIFNSSNQIKGIENKGITNNLESCNQLIQLNDEILRFDFELITKGKKTQELNDTVTTISKDQIYVEEGAIVNHCTLNAYMGPIYIGKNSTIMEGCLIRGPFALGEGSVVKMGTKIYGATTIGPFCTIGGELKNSILTGYSNKAHDGYLGDSIIGEWCNFGAGTSNSNVKNTGGDIKVWNVEAQDYLPAGNKCGVVMGDFTRTAINSSINTGSYYGVCCNVFGESLLPKKVKDFSWGTKGDVYQFEKATEDISNWMRFKNKELDPKMIKILKHLSTLNFS